VRNFIVHRKGDTAEKLRRLLLKYAVSMTPGTSSRAVVDAVLSQSAGTVVRFIGWCDQMEQIAVACVA
jgi:hypothetical protein